MKAILTAILTIFGAKTPGGAQPNPKESPDYLAAQSDFYQAQEALRQARSNMDNAAPGYVDAAVAELNLAFMKSDIATRNLRNVVGIPSPEIKPLSWVQAREEALTQ